MEDRKRRTVWLCFEEGPVPDLSFLLAAFAPLREPSIGTAILFQVTPLVSTWTRESRSMIAIGYGAWSILRQASKNLTYRRKPDGIVRIAELRTPNVDQTKSSSKRPISPAARCLPADDWQLNGEEWTFEGDGGSSSSIPQWRPCDLIVAEIARRRERRLYHS